MSPYIAFEIIKHQPCRIDIKRKRSGRPIPIRFVTKVVRGLLCRIRYAAKATGVA